MQNISLYKKISWFVILSGIFLLVYVSVYFFHIRLFSVDVVLYGAVLDTILSLLIMLVIFVVPLTRKMFQIFELSLFLVVWLFMGMLIALSLPTVIDRSLSFYILEKIDQRGGGIPLSRFEKIFVEEYMIEHRLVDIRLTEQQESKTITIDSDGCVRLTEWGESIVAFSLYFRKNWLPKRRLIMGEYSDDLTDPFRSSPEADYGC